MNERVMQFRIGMFVIVAGLVLTMLIVWFGESPSLLRDHTYVAVHFAEAPGVAEGIPVRKSGIRIGEVAAIRFDDRPKVRAKVTDLKDSFVLIDIPGKGKGRIPDSQFPNDYPDVGDGIDVVVNGFDEAANLFEAALPDGVIVTISLDRKYKLKAGATPRISRALIGDVSIDMLPGTGQGQLETSDNPARAPIIEGRVAPDPTNALASASKAFEKVGGTLESIDRAAKQLSVVGKKAENLDQFIESWRDMGRRVGTLADDLDRVVKANEADLKPAVANVRQFAEKANATFDEKTQANLKASISQLNNGTARLDRVLADVGPLAKDLGAAAGTKPKTDFGQTILRLNGISYDLSLLSNSLRGPDGKLNRNGSLQRLLLEAELYENFNHTATGAREMFGSLRPVIRNFGRFAERIANDPAAIGRGALQR